MRVLPIMLGLAAMAGTTAAAADSPRDRDDRTTVAQATAGLVAGKPQTCLPTRLNTDLRADGPNLIYRVSRTQVYVNTTQGGCENVRNGDALVTVSPTGRLCSGDIAQTVDQVSRFPTGSCALGDFIPYTRPRR